MTCVTCGHGALHDMAGIGVCRAAGCGCDGPCDPQPAPRASGRRSWLDRAVDEALAVCPTMQPWEVRVMLIAAAPTIQNAARENAGDWFVEFDGGRWILGLQVPGQVLTLEGREWTEESAKAMIRDYVGPGRGSDD